MRHDDERIDLSALDPENDPDRLERVAAGVLSRLGPGLVDDPVPVRRQVPHVLARRFRPLLGAASLVAAAAAVALVRTGPPASNAPSAAAFLVGPRDWPVWLWTGSTPRVEELLFLAAGEDR